MNEVGFERAVRQFLRDEYGVTDMRVVPGGKHKHIEFTSPRGAARVSTTWPRYPSGGDWGVTLRVKTKDLRRMLGDPIPQPPKPQPAKKEPQPMLEPTVLADQVRTVLPSLAAQLDQSKPQSPATPVAVTTPIMLLNWRVGAYFKQGHDSLRVFIPRPDVSRFPDRRCRLEPIANDDSWRLVPDPHGRFITEPLSGEIFSLQIPDVYRGKPFGASPATAIVEPDGSIIVRCPPANRVPVRQQAPHVRKTKSPSPRVTTPSAPEPAPPAPAPEPPPTPSRIGVVDPPTLAEIRGCLALIRRIEAETEYRLVKSKELSDWVFVARIE